MITTAAMNQHDERGSAGALIVTGICAVVLVVTVVAATLVSWFTQIRSGEQAAELAALAGVGAAVTGQDACQSARNAAAQNNAELVGCVVRGSGTSVVVEITVAVALRPQLAFGPKNVERIATAGT